MWRNFEERQPSLSRQTSKLNLTADFPDDSEDKTVRASQVESTPLNNDDEGAEDEDEEDGPISFCAEDEHELINLELDNSCKKTETAPDKVEYGIQMATEDSNEFNFAGTESGAADTETEPFEQIRESVGKH